MIIFADIEYLGVEEAKTIEDEMYRIDSFVFNSDVDILNLEEEELNTGNLKESLHLRGILNMKKLCRILSIEITNNYKFQRFVYTGNLIELNNDRKVYHIQDKNKEEQIEDKYIIFY